MSFYRKIEEHEIGDSGTTRRLLDWPRLGKLIGSCKFISQPRTPKSAARNPICSKTTVQRTRGMKPVGPACRRTMSGGTHEMSRMVAFSNSSTKRSALGSSPDPILGAILTDDLRAGSKRGGTHIGSLGPCGICSKPEFLKLCNFSTRATLSSARACGNAQPEVRNAQTTSERARYTVRLVRIHLFFVRGSRVDGRVFP